MLETRCRIMIMVPFFSLSEENPFWWGEVEFDFSKIEDFGCSINFLDDIGYQTWPKGHATSNHDIQEFPFHHHPLDYNWHFSTISLLNVGPPDDLLGSSASARHHRQVVTSLLTQILELRGKTPSSTKVPAVHSYIASAHYKETEAGFSWKFLALKRESDPQNIARKRDEFEKEAIS